MPLPRPIVLGNWKMNGLRAESQALVRALLDGLDQDGGDGTIGVCPPATLLSTVEAMVKGTRLALGGQDCSDQAKGAFTGDVSAAMLKDTGCTFTLVGHSERRHGHCESDALVRSKAEAALRAGLLAVVCIGETEAEWEGGRTIAVLDRQLESSLPEAASSGNLILAYEPVWAIGTGRTPTIQDIAKTHAHLRARLRELVRGGEGVAILYGGSVKATNAGEILAVENLDGALVGGASLIASDFLSIFRAGQADR